METNKQIKKKELFKANQRLIKVLGDLKKAQNDLLVSMNNCALLEVTHANSLKKGVAMMDFKLRLKYYFKVYGDKVIIEEHIDQLRDWKAEELRRKVEAHFDVD